MSHFKHRRAHQSGKQIQDELASPISSIKAAIDAANYAEKGAPFAPFLIKFTGRSDFDVIWTSERGDTPIDFYSFGGRRKDGFLPLGDYAITNRVPFGKQPIMLLAPMADHPEVLAHPTDFDWVLDDSGSGNSNDISYWWPVAPEGYQALGVAFGANKPDPKNYWCVQKNYLQQVATQANWSDSGTHWKHHDGSLSVAAVNCKAPDSCIFLAPTTFLSDEHNRSVGAGMAYCLVVDKLFLPVPESTPVSPVYSDDSGVGSTTMQAVGAVAVIPANIVVDRSAGAEPDVAPFYYLSALPSYMCINAFPAPEGGTYSKSMSIGTSLSSSKTFQETNGINVSASAGISAGEAGGFNAQLSVSYTYEMQVTTSDSIQHDTQTIEGVQLTVPHSNRILLWQKNVELVTIRTDGTRMVNAVYGTEEYTMTCKPLPNNH